MTPALPPVTDVLVDLGRSHTRVVVDPADGGVAAQPVDVRSGRGAGLVDAAGAIGAARTAAAAVRAAVALPERWRLAVCAPGVVTAPARAQEFADALAGAFDPAPSEVLVVSDSAAWQAGAFAGGDGAVVALGTGAVVVARDGATITRLDGRGLLLGDIGGGAWIGLQALRAATDADGPLRDAALARFGTPASWPGLLGEADLAARLAAFVPDVVATAAAGDARAHTVLDAAAAGVAATLAPLPEQLPTAVVGGLAAVLGPRLYAEAPRTWQEPAGDAVAGLRTLLADLGPFAAEASHGASAPREHDTDGLPTEAVAADTADLDTWPTERLVARLAAGHRGATQAVVDAVGPLAHAADLAGAALAGTGRLVYVGAGTPGRLAVQDAAELTPTFALDPARAVVLLAGGSVAGAQAVEGAEDDTAAGARDVDAITAGPADVVVGVTASGRTPYVLAALRRARERGAATVGVCNVVGSPLAAVADVTAELLTGPEVIAGSTRLAAGTAQKIALNTLSSAAMVRAGATFGPWMVDMLASNDKLRRRAVRIVRDAAGVPDATANEALDAADRSVQVALVMLLADVDAAVARDRLAAAGSVRAALATDPQPYGIGVG
ncbi:N-acetylmuramic acid 6-phosphate etherase [Jatrophihabitans endophyticus]|uniref:N-acetylmuramic acid 6-phosphate etherase n=1 Tax=Jatrophihabitans endophyticus TaxID=1206085 RepID=A0A1M5SQM9_9ACTN|nr:N-acetylmuramic acid 6-phosphate etherase [Jatrophihabitans endophyticus]SHH40822.1 N-acetylmuramic acid 6-phosphate etherase [Jatrophihabitans endophyticus]